MASEAFLTVAEVAEILKLNQQTVRNWIDRGELPAVHVGRRVRIKRSDFDRLVEAGYSKAPLRAHEAAVAASIWDGEIPVKAGRKLGHSRRSKTRPLEG
jgi:excisionase family DNA binding protein